MKHLERGEHLFRREVVELQVHRSVETYVIVEMVDGTPPRVPVVVVPREVSEIDQTGTEETSDWQEPRRDSGGWTLWRKDREWQSVLLKPLVQL